MQKALEQFFRIKENGTTIRRELTAGVTTFTAMAYILAVNPDMLSQTGMDRGALITATALASALMTAVMALTTNYPIALAPGMGLNAFFTFTVCIGMGIPWQAALGLVFYSGLLFCLLTFTGIRKKLINAIPHEIKIAISCGIGIFIAFIGLQNGHIVVAQPTTLVTLGNISSSESLLVLSGIMMTGAFVWRKVRGGVVITIITLTLLGLMIPKSDGSGMVTSLPEGFVGMPDSLAPLFLQLDLAYLWTHFHYAFPVVLALLFVDFFDTMGTLIGVSKAGGFLNSKGELPRVERALAADATATMAGACLGTSTVVCYIESATGVEDGGRTGLTALSTSVCFLLALFFTPVIMIIPSAATAPALVIVGIMMMQSISELDFRDFSVAAPAFMTMVMMPLSFSITEGIGFGFITYVGIKLGAGKGREIPAAAYVIAGLFVLHYLYGR